MSTRRLTIDLPEEIFIQLAKIADMTNQSIESIAIQSISSNLPPATENAPLEMQASLQMMQSLSIEELLKIARSQVSNEQQQRHLVLLERRQETDSITPKERQELQDLSITTDQLMLAKAYAWAILRWRGYPMPALEELPLA